MDFSEINAVLAQTLDLVSVNGLVILEYIILFSNMDIFLEYLLE